MRRPVVDYRRVRLNNINTPEFAHLKLLLGWVGYFLLYFLTENLIPPEKCHVVHCALDDLIPFCEVFVIPYVFWYLLVFGSLLYFLLYDVESFKKLQIYIIVTQVVAMAVYLIWPSIQLLRPETFPRQNVLTQILSIIYTVDTPTGVCPSLHAAYSLGIASVWLKRRRTGWGWRAAIGFAAAVICVCVTFVKQHSALDVLWALPLGLLAEWIAYGKDYWLPRLRGKRKKQEEPVA